MGGASAGVVAARRTSATGFLAARGRQRRGGPVVASLGALLLAAGCQFQGPDADDTRYRCGEGGACPTGFHCVNGLCVPEPEPGPTGDAGVGGGRDASDRPADARLADGRPSEPDIDARQPPPPPPDAEPPIDAFQRIETVILGEADFADIRGVTIDTWIDSVDVNNTHGFSPELQIDSGPRQAMLIRFELTDLPGDAVIVSAELGLRIFEPGDGGDQLLARVLLRSWNEQAASWVESSSGRRWPTPGALGTSVGTDVVGAVDADGLGDRTMPIDREVVQGWIDDPGSNFGLRIEADSATDDDVRVHGSESGGASRPYLEVRYRE